MKWPWRRKPNIPTLKLTGPDQRFNVTLWNGRSMPMYLHDMTYSQTRYSGAELTIRFVFDIEQRKD